MKNLQDCVKESLVMESQDYVIYMPCTEPEAMEDIYWSIVDEFGDDSDMDRSSWTMGDDTVKCYVQAKSTSQIKKFAKEYDAKFEKR